MNYSQKLTDFNASEKYIKELGFLRQLIGQTEALDYGCGNGFAAELFKCDGYDTTVHNPFFAYQPSPFKRYETVYFMHSLAHIEDPEAVLRGLNLSAANRVVVITPNREWLEQASDDYEPDQTVIGHFNQILLENLFTKSGFKIVNSGQFGQRIGGVNERLFLVATREI